MVGWSFPDPQSGDLSVQARQEGSATFLEVVSLDENGRPLSAADTRATIVSPGLESTDLTIPQVGAGRYRVELPADSVGAYLVSVSQTDENGEPLARSERGFVVPYSPEYRIQPADETLLAQLAARTGGESRTLDDPASVFVRPPQQVTKARELWPWLLALALLLFPFDVAVRRVMFGQREWETVRAWLRARGRPQLAPRRARSRCWAPSSRRRSGQSDDRRPTTDDRDRRPTTATTENAERRAQSEDQRAPTTESAGDNAPPESADEGDTLARLRGAKRRTRR